MQRDIQFLMGQEFPKEAAGVCLGTGSVPKLEDSTYAERHLVVDGTGVPKRGVRIPRGHWAVSQSWKTQLMQRDI